MKLFRSGMLLTASLILSMLLGSAGCGGEHHRHHDRDEWDQNYEHHEGDRHDGERHEGERHEEGSGRGH
jgi:hypothetical protein